MGSIPRRESAENVENRSRCVDAAADAAVDARLDESSEFDVQRNTFVSHDQGNRQRSTQFFLKHNSQRSESDELFSKGDARTDVWTLEA